MRPSVNTQIEAAKTFNTQREADHCPNCGAARIGAYCQQCGQKRSSPEDLSAKRFLKETLHEATDLDSTVFRTFVALLFRPGLLTVEYLAERKGRYLTPVKLYLIISAVYFILAWDASLEISNFEEGLRANPALQNLPLPQTVNRSVFFQLWFEKAGEYSAYFRFASILGFGLALAVLYRSARRYFGEHLIFAFHYYSFDFCFFSLLIPFLMIFQVITGWRAPAWPLYIGFVFLPIYTFFALRMVYRETILIAAVKSLLLLMCDFALTLIGDILALALSALTVYLDLRQ